MYLIIGLVLKRSPWITSLSPREVPMMHMSSASSCFSFPSVTAIRILYLESVNEAFVEYLSPWILNSGEQRPFFLLSPEFPTRSMTSICQLPKGSNWLKATRLVK